MPTLDSILVPVDGSPPSLAALEHAIALAEDYSARVNVLTVFPPTDPLSRDARADDERALDAALVRAHDVLGNRVSRETAVGDPLMEIIERAQKKGTDLIVIGTHGRIGRLHSLLGSTAEGVVRNAPCPVLTVRGTGEGYQGFAERRHHRASLGDQHPQH